MSRRRIVGLLWLLVALVFLVRAGYGLVAGISFSEGRRLARLGAYERALPLLDRAGVGHLVSEAHWLAGQVRLGLWQQTIEQGAEPEDAAPLLAQAYADSSAALAASPASGWYWMALGNLYHQAERLSVHRQGIPLGLVGADDWAFVGRPGRIAIGMMRVGLEREPNWYPFHDQLAYVFYDYRMRDETLGAVYRSARALPVYELHAYPGLQPQDPEIVDTFARGAIDSLGEVPWLRPVTHRIALGRLELRRERFDEAEGQLREALVLATVPLDVAEAHYHLGRALAGLERPAEATEAFHEAESEPPLEPLAVIAQARLAEKAGTWPLALELWQRARRLTPRRLDVALSLADAAVQTDEFDLAAHTLREASRVHPDRREPLIELIRLFVARGDYGKARSALSDLERLGPDHPSVTRARQDLERRR